MDITLTPEIATALAEEARRRSTTPELLALDCLRERFVPAAEGEAPAEGTSLADFLEGYIGVFASEENAPGGAQMSKDTGKRFSEGMIRKRQQGRL